MNDRAKKNQANFFARTNFRDYEQPVGIKRSDRLAHMYIIGKTGTGKTTLLETMIRQDVENEERFAPFVANKKSRDLTL